MPKGIGNQNRIGTCPHGMPPGGCPICSGMGGGGAAAKKPVATSEMSWNECFAIGQMMKAAKQNAELNKQTNENTLLQNSLMNKIAMFMAEKVAALKNFIAQSVVVQTASKLVQNIASAAKPIVNFIKQPLVILKNILTKPMSNLKQIFVDISDKLAAVYGEAKKSIEKFLEESSKKIKKGVLSLFGLVEETNKQAEESEEAENEKRKLFNLNKFKKELSKFFNYIKETP